MLYDITRTVSTQLAVWPGDAAYQVQPVLKIEQGHSVNLTTLIMSPHTGTHSDAYYHYQIDGAHPAEMPLDSYIGRAHVVTVHKGRGELLPEDFAHVDLTGCERLLIHSRVSDLPDSAWATKFVFLSVPLIDWLADLGVRLIGLDSPSVDDFESKDLPCHHRLYQRGMVNLESLNLRDVPDGIYELIALPLKLDLACGSPVRAVLKTL
ncbi:MAG: cyclase family protein [Anaerolineae bacterium]|jgi:arylformamidase|nr:cyclase family protein [Anaerolineae bacterium]